MALAALESDAGAMAGDRIRCHRNESHSGVRKHAMEEAVGLVRVEFGR